MECCWCLWKADGIELLEPFVEAAFNIMPEKSRSKKEDANDCVFSAGQRATSLVECKRAHANCWTIRKKNGNYADQNKPIILIVVRDGLGFSKM
jgi:hypothetical protein